VPAGRRARRAPRCNRWGGQFTIRSDGPRAAGVRFLFSGRAAGHGPPVATFFTNGTTSPICAYAQPHAPMSSFRTGGHLRPLGHGPTKPDQCFRPMVHGLPMTRRLSRHQRLFAFAWPVALALSEQVASALPARQFRPDHPCANPWPDRSGAPVLTTWCPAPGLFDRDSLLSSKP